MTRPTVSLRWLIGGIYFFIMVAILGVLALYFRQRTEVLYMGYARQSLGWQVKMGADLLSLSAAPRTPNGPLELNFDEDNKDAGTDGVTKDIDTNVTKKEGDTTGRMLRKIFYRSKIFDKNAIRSVTLISPDGRHYRRIPSLAPELILPIPPTNEVADVISGKMALGEDIRTVKETGELTLFMAAPVIIQDDRSAPAAGAAHPRRPHPQAVLILAAQLTDVQEEIKRVQNAIGLAFLGSMVVLLLINIALSTYMTRPLATLSHAAVRFASGDLTRHVSTAGAAEITSLGHSFNRMADQLRRTITRLAEERAQAEAILASMVDGVVVVDPQGKVLQVNATAEQILGIREPAVIGKPLSEVIVQYEINNLLTEVISTGTPVMAELAFSHPKERTMEVHLAPVGVGDRRIGIVTVLYDITRQRQLENMRRDFVANVSHELRTPVTSIRAMSETLLEAARDDPELTTEFLQTIISESERLTAMLDDLLQLSRIESGSRQFTPEVIDLSELIRHVARRMMAPVTARQQHLCLELPEHLPALVDSDAIIQILVNLLDNARKYSPPGGTITVTLEQGDDLRLSVADTGYGIPASALSRIFERFYRVDKGRSRAEGGTGLGLAIVKHLVDIHGGEITVESEPGVGSRFTVILPSAALVGEEASAAGESEKPS